MAELILHPDAARRIDTLGTELLSLLRTETPLQGPKEQFPSPHIAVELNEKNIIGDIKFGITDGFGADLGKSFQQGEKLIGLSGERYQRLIRTAEIVLRSHSFKACVSMATLKDILFAWTRSAYCRETTKPLSQYLIETCAPLIQRHQVWIPISYLQIQAAFPFGHVEFVPVTETLLDSWFRDSQDEGLTSADPRVKRFDQLKKKMQGYAAVRVEVEAEPDRAIEIAHERANTSISMLRLFHPASFHPKLVCFCDFMGRSDIGYTTTLWFTQRGALNINQESVHPAGPLWRIPTNQLHDISQAGLLSLHNLLRASKPNDYESRLLRSLRVFTKVSSSSNIADKLVYLMTSLEGFLLRNNSEPVCHNIADRMAFTLGNTQQERVDIANNALAAYALRSKYLHHAERIHDEETLEVFMLNAWTIFLDLIMNNKGFSTHEQFIAWVEARKYGGN